MNYKHYVINSRPTTQIPQHIGFDTMVSNVGDQCHMVVAEFPVDNQKWPSMMLTNFGIIYVLLLYTVVLGLLGFLCGCRVVWRKSFLEKMTMTPVTHTFVRKVRHPRFEFSEVIEGCW